MINKQSVETHSRNDGHTEEDGDTGQQGLYFMLHARVVIGENDEHQQHRGEAYRDGKAGAE